MSILKISIINEEESSDKIVSTTPEADNVESIKLAENKINGRLTISEIQAIQQDKQLERKQTVQDSSSSYSLERPSDEKIIAEILKPEERIRLSKNADRLFKVPGNNTTISLD